MEKPIMFRSICVLLLASSAVVARAAEEEVLDPQWGAETSGCRLSLELKPRSIQVGQPIVAQLTLENVGKESVSVIRTNPMVVMRFDVRLPNGKAAPLTLKGQQATSGPVSGSMTAFKMEPGLKNVDGVSMLNRLYDMTLTGEYKVTAYRKILIENKAVYVPSSTATVTVHE